MVYVAHFGVTVGTQRRDDQPAPARMSWPAPEHRQAFAALHHRVFAVGADLGAQTHHFLHEHERREDVSVIRMIPRSPTPADGHGSRSVANPGNGSVTSPARRAAVHADPETFGRMSRVAPEVATLSRAISRKADSPGDRDVTRVIAAPKAHVPATLRPDCGVHGSRRS